MLKRTNLIAAALALLVFAGCAGSVFAARILRVEERFGCTLGSGQTVTEGQVLMMKDDGLCYLADADDPALRPAIGVAGFAQAAGGAVEVVTKGQVGGLSALTEGASLFLSGTAGGTTQTRPSSYAQTVGMAISTTQYVLDIQKAMTARSVVVPLPDPGVADADITAGYVLFSPSVAATITKILHIPQAAWIAAAPANDATIVVTNAAVGAVATLAVQTALAVGSKNDMGTITNADVVADTNVTIAITTNGTANAPASSLQIEYLAAD